jgi:hypothetical protein
MKNMRLGRLFIELLQSEVVFLEKWMVKRFGREKRDR